MRLLLYTALLAVAAHAGGSKVYRFQGLSGGTANGGSDTSYWWVSAARYVTSDNPPAQVVYVSIQVCDGTTFSPNVYDSCIYVAGYAPQSSLVSKTLNTLELEVPDVSKLGEVMATICTAVGGCLFTPDIAVPSLALRASWKAPSGLAYGEESSVTGRSEVIRISPGVKETRVSDGVSRRMPAAFNAVFGTTALPIPSPSTYLSADMWTAKGNFMVTLSTSQN
jgi:hypothetical protein